MLHVAHDAWHMTHDMWWTLCNNFRSLALIVLDLWCFEDLVEKDHWLNQQISELMTEVFVEQPGLHHVL